MKPPFAPQHLFFTFCFFAALALNTNALHGQNQSVFEEPLELENTVDWYNQEKQGIEIAIKKKECKTDRAEAKQRFIAELQRLDSLIVTTPLSEIPALCKDNKMIIVSKWKEGSTCVKIGFESQKYLKGCPVPVYSDSVSWDGFKNLNKAISEEKVCVKRHQFSNYTQVEKIPDAEFSDESALLLLHQIERFLTAYGTQVGASYPDYVAYEKSKNIASTQQAVQFRTAFLNKCLAKVKP